MRRKMIPSANPKSDQLEEYRRFYHERKAERQTKLRELMEEARQVAASAAELLRTQFGVTRVILFGSLVHPELFHFQSDIDLAVWGLAEEDYYRTVGILQSLNPKFSVDLVRFEDISPDFQALILKEGQDL
jgi:predicted nucleotidyltransferase